MNRSQDYRAGMAAYNAGRYDEAIRRLEAVARSGRGVDALLSRFYLGRAYYERGAMLFGQHRFGEACRAFQAAAQASPSQGGLARYLAGCYLGMGRFDQALPRLEEALRAEPDDAGTRIRLALARWKAGDPVGAAAALREGMRRRPDHAEFHYQLGVMLAAQEEIAEAQTLLERAVALDPTHAGAYERLAQCCGVAGRAERALRYLERAHQLDPGNPRLALQISVLAASTNLEPYVRIPRRSKDRTVARDQAALDELGQVIVAEPDFVEAFLALPQSDVDDEVFSALAATLECALRRHPEFADLHYHCSEVYRRLGRSAEALAHAEQARQINPSYVKALILLAQLYAQTDEWQTGVDRLNQAIEAGGDYPDVHCLMGRLYEKGNRPDDARRAYERALTLNGGYAEARRALDSLTLSAGRG